LPSQRNLLHAGLIAAAAFWILEAAIHTWVFHEGDHWLANLVPTDANEWWMRTLASGLLVALGAYGDRSVRSLERAEAERRAIQEKLDDALTRVLESFLPICANCKAIRDEEKWVKLERYVTDHAKTRFSHALCPTCLPLYDQDL
jgi:hypothetical protein